MIIKTEAAPIYRIQNYLPQNINFCLSHVDSETLNKITELRMRKNGLTTVTVEGKNCILTKCGIQRYSGDICNITEQELEDFIYKICKGSVYSHENTLNKFFITASGIRIGLSGTTGTDGKLSEITGVNIRLPHHIDGCSCEVIEYFDSDLYAAGKGILIISKPGVGKTTLLRDFACKLSHPQRHKQDKDMLRVCVIDERYEIDMPGVFSSCCTDFISGTDKIFGIETATRLLSPQVIICDEISGPDEAEKITRCKNSGTCFIASYHSDCAENALKKPFIKSMFDEGVFGAVYTLERKNGKVTGELFVYDAEK